MADDGKGAGAISLDQLVALNDEIVALTRAGLPLEWGLREVGRDVSGRLSAAMLSLSARMEGGASLSDAMDAEGGRFPPIYRAVVKAGLRAGRLPLALEGLAAFVRTYAEARRTIGLALIYPLTVVGVAYALFLLMVVVVVPRFVSAFESLHVPIPLGLRGLAYLGELPAVWAAVPPLIFLVLAGWWAWTGRASALAGGGIRSPLGWFPWVRSMMAQFECATFAQLLAILLDQEVPYPEALVLAAEASGDARLARAGVQLAEAIGRGDPGAGEHAARGLPPLLRWLLVRGREQGRLADALRQIAAIYRKRAAEQAEKIRLFVPTILLVGLGVSATLIYGLTLFVPFSALLRGLSMPAP
jgi:general secretion pathway protein F